MSLRSDKAVPLPGMVLVQLFAPYDPCRSMYDQPLRVVRHAPGYSGPLEAGMVVMVADAAHGARGFYDEEPPAALVRLDSIVAVIKP